MSIVEKFEINYIQSTVNISTLSYAISIGWIGSVFILYDSDKSPLPSGRVPLDQLAWIGSILGIGGVIGTIFIGWFADAIGRKNSLIAMTVPQVVSISSSWNILQYLFIYLLRDTEQRTITTQFQIF